MAEKWKIQGKDRWGGDLNIVADVNGSLAEDKADRLEIKCSGGGCSNITNPLAYILRKYGTKVEEPKADSLEALLEDMKAGRVGNGGLNAGYTERLAALVKGEKK